jgi:hypothetical protein
MPPDALAYEDARVGGGLKALQDLEETGCRWPIGDPLAPDFGFCAASPERWIAYSPDWNVDSHGLRQPCLCCAMAKAQAAMIQLQRFHK